MLVLSHMPRLARVTFWTLCISAYTLAIWCTLVLLFGWQFLPFTPPIVRGWPKEADFTSLLCLLVSLALIPFVVFFRRSSLCVWAGLGIWFFHILWFFAFPVF